MEYSLKVESVPRPAEGFPAGPPETRTTVSVNGGLSEGELLEKLAAYAQIWHIDMPKPKYFLYRLTAAFDDDLGIGEIAFEVDSQGMFSSNIHVLTILASD